MSRVTIAGAWLILSAFAAPLRADPEADALAQRFLAHLDANGPVAGTFELRGTFDPALYEERRRAVEKPTGNDRVKHVFERDSHVLVCRWAWDRGREMSETLADSKNIFATFYRDGEAFLHGGGPQTFT